MSRICATGTRLGKAVEWNHVGALGEDRNSIDDELKRSSPLIRIAAQLYRAKSGADVGGILRFSSDRHARVKRVQRLAAISRWIPQLRMIDGDRHLDVIDARMQVGRLRGGQLFAGSRP